jgi:hypothetical protein
VANPVKSVTRKGDKAGMIHVEGMPPIWTPDYEVAVRLIGSPIPNDWTKKDGEYGPQAFPPKVKGQSRYRDTKEAFDAEAKSRAAWQREEEDRKDRRTALMTAFEWVSLERAERVPEPGRVTDLPLSVASLIYIWLKTSAPSPTGQKTSPGEAGGAETGPGEVPSLSSPGSTYTGDPAICTHLYPSGAPAKVIKGGREICKKCGMPWVTAVEGTTEDLGSA